MNDHSGVTRNDHSGVTRHDHSGVTKDGREVVFLIDDYLYSAILCSLKQTHCARMWFYMSD